MTNSTKLTPPALMYRGPRSPKRKCYLCKRVTEHKLERQDDGGVLRTCEICGAEVLFV